jgi:hypothetical protein
MEAVGEEVSPGRLCHGSGSMVNLLTMPSKEVVGLPFKRGQDNRPIHG